MAERKYTLPKPTAEDTPDYDEATDLAETLNAFVVNILAACKARGITLTVGEDGRVMAPPELAGQVREDAAAALAQYTPSG